MESGWVTSIPGAAEITVEALPGSTLPDALLKVGYNITETGEPSASCRTRPSRSCALAQTMHCSLAY